MIDVEHLKKTYLIAIRKLTKNDWIQISKKDMPLIEDLAKNLDLKQMEAQDYIAYHFGYAKGYMSIKYLASPDAIRRFEVHQKMKGRYNTKEYSIDGEDFYVNSTYKRYKLDQVKSGSAQDMDANYALTMCEENYKVSNDLWEAAEYTYCKFLYKGKTPPIKLIKMLEECRNVHDGKI